MDKNKFVLPKCDFIFFDIAANLCSEEFQGIYHEKKYHETDVDEVIERANKMGVKKMLFAAGNFEDTKISYNLSKKSSNYYITSGIHPCRTTEALKLFNNDIESIFKNLDDLINLYKDKIIAIGECGLDYDLLHYSNKEDQLKLFSPHFSLAEKYNLPMYFHDRNSNDEFYNIVKENRNKFNKGIVHSFTGSEDELNKYLSLNLYIGVTGASFRTKNNIEVVKKIPNDKLLFETDAPYCEIRSSNAAFQFVETSFKGRLKKEKMKKGFMCKERNEPCTMIQVLEALSKIKEIDKKELSEICYKNSLDLFNLKD